MVGVAVRVQKSGGKVAMARIGVTGLSNRAYRAEAAEKALTGTAGSAADVQAAAVLVAKGVDANSDLHASADYRKHLASVYAARALTAALA
jgi:carbon-monoxide dehydrogenase medium subunit